MYFFKTYDQNVTFQFTSHCHTAHSSKNRRFLRTAIHSCMCAKLLQSYLTLCDPIDCSPPGSSVHGTSQARILEWFAMPPPGDPPNPAIEPEASPSSSLLQADSLPLSHPGSPRCRYSYGRQVRETEAVAEIQRYNLP